METDEIVATTTFITTRDVRMGSVLQGLLSLFLLLLFLLAVVLLRWKHEERNEVSYMM